MQPESANQISTTEALELAATVAPHAVLLAIRMMHGYFQMHPAEDFSQEEAHQVQGRVSFQQLDEVKTTALVEFRMVLPLPNAQPASSVEIRSAFEVIYQIEDRDSRGEDAAEAFTRINAIFNAWPYWREFVSNSVARTGSPPQFPQLIMQPSAAALAGYATETQ